MSMPVAAELIPAKSGIAQSKRLPALAEALLFLVLLVPSAVFAWKNLDMPQFGFQHDDTIYYVCAKAWATGTGTSDHQPAAAALADEVPPGVSTVVVFGMEDHAGVPVELARLRPYCAG